jgi:hypothetical protein
LFILIIFLSEDIEREGDGEGEGRGGGGGKGRGRDSKGWKPMGTHTRPLDPGRR